MRALDVEWGPGTVEGKSDKDILAGLRKAELPLAVPSVPVLTKTVKADFVFWFASNSALETNGAIADVRRDWAEIWAGLESPIAARGAIAPKLGMTPTMSRSTSPRVAARSAANCSATRRWKPPRRPRRWASRSS